MAPRLLALAAAACAHTALAQIVTVPWPTASKAPLNISMGYATVNSTGTRFNWYAATLDDLQRFTIALPAGGCAVRDTTTNTAIANKCAVAVNAGFFQFSPKPTYCMGEIVIDGEIMEWTGDGSPLLAVSSSSRSSFVGVFTKADVAAMNVSYAVAAFGVIVENGRVSAAGVAQASATVKALRPTAEEIAPRTVLALDTAGRLLLVAIDGVEALGLGLTMTELAQAFAGGAAGFTPGLDGNIAHALNADGGGSTTMSSSPAWPANAQIFNRPTNTDVGPITERDVTSIACIKG
jgi:exopolysaccharide biosynthesis protein